MTRRIIFITGGAGFIGSNIAAHLAQDLTYDVVVCDRLRSSAGGKWRNIAKHLIGDLVHPDDMFDWLEKRWREIDLVIHMAAVSSPEEPDADRIVHANFGLSRDLFRWCADRQRRLVYASSAETYGDGTQGLWDDNDLSALAALRPLTPHGWSKALFDLFAVRQAARGYAPPQWAGLKLFDVYGPNEAHKGARASLPHQVWTAARRGRPARLPLQGARDHTHVDDVAKVAAWLLATPEVSGIFNLGAGAACTAADLAQKVFKLAGANPGVEPALGGEDAPAPILQADTARLRAAGYAEPFLSLEAGLADYCARLSLADPYR